MTSLETPASTPAATTSRSGGGDSHGQRLPVRSAQREPSGAWCTAEYVEPDGG